MISTNEADFVMIQNGELLYIECHFVRFWFSAQIVFWQPVTNFALCQ